MNANNTTARKPTAIFTKWNYKTGEQLDHRQIFMDPIDFIQSIRDLWPGEHAIRYNAEWHGYDGVFKNQDDKNAPFVYRFELSLFK